jgi:hypothetical protein
VKDLTGSSTTGAAADAAAAVPRDLREAQRWAREVLRRGFLESLYLGSSLAIVGGILVWLYRLLMHKPALQSGLFLAAAAGISLIAYHFARWRASAGMSRQVEKFTAWLIAAFGVALVWGAICFAFTFGALRWFSAPAPARWIIGATACLCGFACMVAGEWRELGDCLARPAAANENRQPDESNA